MKRFLAALGAVFFLTSAALGQVPTSPIWGERSLSDVVYWTVDGQSMKLNLYFPTKNGNSLKNVPFLIWIDSGGRLACMLGMSDKSREFEVGEHLEQSSQVQVVVDVCGSTYLPLVYVNYPSQDAVGIISRVSSIAFDPRAPRLGTAGRNGGAYEVFAGRVSRRRVFLDVDYSRFRRQTH